MFELGRQERFLKDIKSLIFSEIREISDYEIKDGKDQEQGAWYKHCTLEVWNGKDKHRWYRTRVEIPAEFVGKQVEFLLFTGREGEWDAENPQMLFYINNEIVQGIDVNHTRVTLSKSAVAGECFDIKFLAYSGTTKDELILKTQLAVLDVETEQLYYDLYMPIEAAKVLKDVKDEGRRILKKLSMAGDVLDLRIPYSDCYYKSVQEARAILKREFYTNVDDSLPIVSAIGHTHIDIAWLWTVAQTREKVLRSFSTVLRLMEEYPEYCFMSSQPILYQFVKEQEPEMYEKIKARVKEGRWEVDGAMWLEPDCNLTNGESLVRQLIKGRRFFLDEFGIESKSLWLPDVFGYSAALPQILKKSGIQYFMTTKISWNQFNMLPNDAFMWKGIDGTEIFAYMPTTSDFNRMLTAGVTFSDKMNTTTYTGLMNPNMALGTYERFQNKDLQENTLMLFGYGDGGGGPTRDMLECARRLSYGLPGIPRVVQEPEGDFFDRTYQNMANNPDLPKWQGELYFEYHRGTYTSMAKNKRFNRKSELLYEDIESLASSLSGFDVEYPKTQIEKGWDVILLNQFHDIIPGSSIEEVYKVTDMEYEQIIKDGTKLMSDLLMRLGEQVHGKADCFLVYNSMGYERDDVVELDCPYHDVEFVEDMAGSSYDVQYVGENRILFFAKKVPSLGYQVYRFVRGTRKEAKIDLFQTFENSYYKVEFNEVFEIISLLEKETGKEFIQEGGRGNVLNTYEDRPIDWDNWDIDIFHKRKQYSADKVTKAKLIEMGPVRYAVEVTHYFLDSYITQIIYLYPEIERIDFKNTADWKHHNIVLKACFDVDVNTRRAAYEIQFGSAERETTSNTSWDMAKFETCGHKWADLSETGAGISLLNDCKYGYDIKDGHMNLTLIKAGTYPNPNADIGFHEFTYSIYPHQGSLVEADTIKMAYNLNVPLYSSSCAASASGKLGGFGSFAKTDADNCFIEVIKQAEDQQGMIVRVYENKNKRSSVTMTFDRKINSVSLCNLMEQNIEKLKIKENSFQFSLKPYEISSFRVQFQSV